MLRSCFAAMQRFRQEKAMPMLEVGFVILCVVFLLLAVFSVPLFYQIWRAARNVSTALELLNQSLPGILKNVEEITANLNNTTYVLNKEIEDISILTRKIRGMLAFTDDVGRILRGDRFPLLGTFKTTKSILRGLRVFFDVLLEKKSDEDKILCQE